MKEEEKRREVSNYFVHFQLSSGENLAQQMNSPFSALALHSSTH